jgi:tripartite-type tricarboxylate transporter receptor subunit TctC
MKRRHLLALATTAALSTTLIATPSAFAQSAGYPNRPIKLVVPFPAGISPDVVARLIGDKLSVALGQPVVVDNKPGAGGMIGAVAAGTAPADGYTLFFSVKATHAIAPNVYRDAKYNPPRDFKGPMC